MSLAVRIQDFVNPIDPFVISNDEGYKNGQIGKFITDNNDIDAADIVIVGCAEWRGGFRTARYNPAENVREELYKLFHWHENILIADAGNVLIGNELTDTYAALKMVVAEITREGKRAVVIGGSHDLTTPLYHVFAERNQIIEISLVDAFFDIDRENYYADKKFLLDMLLGEPNYVRHFNIIGFQSYFTYPKMLETIDKLRFDCYRVGFAQEKMEEMEPSFRSSQLVSIDMCAIAHAFGAANALSPNGFSGQDMCKLSQYAGMSPETEIFTILGYGGKDTNQLTAMQIAQMIWYYIDGFQKQAHEAPLTQTEAYIEYHTICAEVETVFLQSRNTGRWWMKMPDGKFVPCTYLDYYQASNNDLPDRWLRIQERL
ncbi:arginase family protein [Polluticaenibacter yanchengensis]|uniref:Arginase family protein n=1 Tax=Polluticaenibacter yanchengensis TaxID=3014562 RepID=A0ABT4UFC9_9BACT|nr:arginase family protein [Chitinophagaceae bacterium LY-5]